MRTKSLLRIALSAGAVSMLCGCPNPNTYTNPRTIDPGRVQWQLAPEVIGANYTQTTQVPNASGTGTTTQQTTESGFSPMVPTFGARIGIADGFDLGARLANFDSLGIDGKIRLLKGTFDLALDPGLQGYYVTADGTSAAVVYTHLPILLGFNVSQSVTIDLSPGVTYALSTASVNQSGVQGTATASGLMGRLGLGFDFRISKSFAIHPEFTVLKQFGDANALIYVGGLGFNFGAQPDYSDLAGGGGGAPPAAQ